jgi:hypothetical protein
MPAIAAMRFNRVLREFAERLRAKGKYSEAIIAAVMRKLVVLAFRLIRDATKTTPVAA